VTDVARNFSEYVNRVNNKGEHFVLVKSGKEVAELKPIPNGRRLSELAALLKMYSLAWKYWT
jgi:prevent-host-death family protein